MTSKLPILLLWLAISLFEVPLISLPALAQRPAGTEAALSLAGLLQTAKDHLLYIRLDAHPAGVHAVVQRTDTLIIKHGDTTTRLTLPGMPVSVQVSRSGSRVAAVVRERHKNRDEFVLHMLDEQGQKRFSTALGSAADEPAPVVALLEQSGHTAVAFPSIGELRLLDGTGQTQWQVPLLRETAFDYERSLLVRPLPDESGIVVAAMRHAARPSPPEDAGVQLEVFALDGSRLWQREFPEQSLHALDLLAGRQLIAIATYDAYRQPMVQTTRFVDYQGNIVEAYPDLFDGVAEAPGGGLAALWNARRLWLWTDNDESPRQLWQVPQRSLRIYRALALRESVAALVASPSFGNDGFVAVAPRLLQIKADGSVQQRAEFPDELAREPYLQWLPDRERLAVFLEQRIELQPWTNRP